MVIGRTRVSSMNRANIRSPLYGCIDKVKMAAALESLSYRMTKVVSLYSYPIVRWTCLSEKRALNIGATPILDQFFRHWTLEKPSWVAFFLPNTPVSGSTPPNTTRPTSHGLSAVFIFFKHPFLENSIEDHSKRCLEGTVIPIGLLRYRSGVWNTGIRHKSKKTKPSK